MLQWLRTAGLRSLPIAGFLALWEGVSRAGIVSEYLFPPPTIVLRALARWAGTGELWHDIELSSWRLVAGFLLGGSSAVVLGMVMGRNRYAAAVFGPLFQALRALPPVAIIPLVIVWLGIGESAKVFSIACAVFFPTWINTYLGAQRIPREYLWAARILRPSGQGIFWRVLVPATMPSIIAGLRTALALAFVMVYVSEIAGASAGLGYRISIAHLAYRIDLMMAALAVLGTFGALADFAFDLIAHALFPWLADKREGAR